MFFTPEDFKLFSEYSGKKVKDCPKDAHEQLKVIYSKLEEIAGAMKQYGFTPVCKKNPQSASRENSFKLYLWAQLYSDTYPACKDQVMFNLSFSKEGFSMAVDRKRNNPKIDKFDKKEGSNCFQRANDICSYSTETINQEVLESLSKDDLIERVYAYCTNPVHEKEFLEIGSIYGIDDCVKEFNNLKMEEYKELLLNNRNIILTGAPGTGKTYLAKEIIAKALGATEKNGRLGFVQFHPSYDYTDFVEGLRPVKKDTDTIGFERMDGIFMAFCRKALGDKDNKYVFIIDEINRGEMSKILGELFFSIDPEYRGKKGKVSTQYSNLWKQGDKPNFDDDDKFYIPKNVYIIGTMNDIDRSVESMDFAMRRRFAFKEVTPEERQAMIDANEKRKGQAEEIKNCMNRLNKAIVEKTPLGLQYQVGPAYFLKLAHYLENGNLTSASWKQLWDNHLQGLLFEYFRGDPKQKDYINTLENEYFGKSKETKK